MTPVTPVPAAGPTGHSGGPRLPLRRPPRTRPDGTALPSGRVLAGVSAGLAAHLGVPVTTVRIVLVLTSALGGCGALLYLLLWLLVPVGDPWAEGAGDLPAARARLAGRLGVQDAGAREGSASPRRQLVVLGVCLLLAAGAVVLWRHGLLGGSGWFLPAMVVVAGAALAWSQVEAVTGPSRDRAAMVRLAVGVFLSALGILAWIGTDTSLRNLVAGALVGGALVAGIGLVLAPLWLRTNQALAATRAAEAREAERADIAAHLHDSVLQTLTLIRRRANEPETVARLARSQERELRAWLYTDRPAAGTSVGDAMRDLVGEIEDLHGVPIDLVVVGDRAPDRATEVIVAAAREALSNAVRHGAAPVSVYAEITPERLEVFVRDRGPGFVLDEVAPDRHGVRESIVGRMERHGGAARLRRLERGTEVHLALPAPTGPQPAGP
ncbi:ATP-binding protein [Actinomyces howellii]|uniref:Sensory histidine kinase UhpB n=1 Tax=Actinomyces howellii TaxID=52771 RepID=A0A3S4T9C7_9ACTO|nr:ATP-binding protein [Actinomyces howellii]VEG27373.1 sensory histidine kinase UhpB [Actinomyces howellii]